MNKPLQFEESMALLNADRMANDARLSNILQSLNQYSVANFDLLKQSTLAAHRLQLKLVRKEKVIKKLQHQLKTMTKAQNKKEQMIEDETKSEEESMRTVVDCTTLTRIINSYTHIAHQVYCWYSFCNRAHHSFFKFFFY